MKTAYRDGIIFTSFDAPKLRSEECKREFVNRLAEILNGDVEEEYCEGFASLKFGSNKWKSVISVQFVDEGRKGKVETQTVTLGACDAADRKRSLFLVLTIIGACIVLPQYLLGLICVGAIGSVVVPFLLRQKYISDEILRAQKLAMRETSL